MSEGMRVILVLSSLQAVASCGGPNCGDHSRNEDGAAPLVKRFHLIDQQVPGDPWSVLVGIDFTDKDGDLGRGMVEFYLNDSSKAADQELDSVFRQSGVAFDATSGSLWTNIRFADSVSDGTEADVGVQLLDTAAPPHRSNCFTITIHFSVTQLSGGGLRRNLAAVRRACPERG